MIATADDILTALRERHDDDHSGRHLQVCGISEDAVRAMREEVTADV